MRDESNMKDERAALWRLRLTECVEAAQIHHNARDADHLRPGELREVLRLMYFLLLDFSEPLGG